MQITRNRILTVIFTGLSALYIVLIAVMPVDKSTLTKYHVDSGQVIWISLTVAIPYLIIWFIALLGYIRFKTYTQTIRKSKDGDAFQTVSTGILWLALWLPISTIFGTIASGYYFNHPSKKALMIILENYLNLLILVPAFLLIYEGTRKLLKAIKKHDAKLPQSMLIFSIIFSVFYTFLVFRDPNRQFAMHGVSVAAYYLPDWLTATTIVIPRLIMWFLALQAVYNIFLFRRVVKGAIYKAGLNDLANGLSVVIIVLVALRFFDSLASQLNKLALGAILLLVYLLLAALAVGFILIARGARKLQRIEEI